MSYRLHDEDEPRDNPGRFDGKIITIANRASLVDELGERLGANAPVTLRFVNRDRVSYLADAHVYGRPVDPSALVVEKDGSRSLLITILDPNGLEDDIFLKLTNDYVRLLEDAIETPELPDDPQIVAEDRASALLDKIEKMDGPHAHVTIERELKKHPLPVLVEVCDMLALSTKGSEAVLVKRIMREFFSEGSVDEDFES